MSVSAMAEPPLLARIERWFDDITLLQAVTGLTFGLAMFFGFEDIPFRFGIQIALMAVLLRPRLLQRKELWLAISITATCVLAYSWSTADNHKYLLVYWLWVVTFACFVADEGRADGVLRSHARFFLVFVFLVAVVQKLASPTYMSGEMFELKLLIDDRFKAFGHLIGVDRSIPELVNLEFAKLKSPLAVYEHNALQISSSDYIRTVAAAITWYDLLVQISIGLLFLPGKPATDRIGHLLLLFFIITTYLPAPVFGFGWTLAIYGFTLAKGRFPRLTVAYAVAFAAILAYQAPWREWVLEW